MQVSFPVLHVAGVLSSKKSCNKFSKCFFWHCCMFSPPLLVNNFLSPCSSWSYLDCSSSLCPSILFVLPEVTSLSQGEVGLLTSATQVHCSEQVINCCSGEANKYIVTIVHGKISNHLNRTQQKRFAKDLQRLRSFKYLSACDLLLFYRNISTSIVYFVEPLI